MKPYREPKHPVATAVAVAVLVGILVLWVVGCAPQPKFVEGKYPVIEVPPRPALPPQPLTWSTREEVMRKYIADLTLVIDSYNGFAKERNTVNGYKE